MNCVRAKKIGWFYPNAKNSCFFENRKIARLFWIWVNPSPANRPVQISWLWRILKKAKIKSLSKWARDNFWKTHFCCFWINQTAEIENSKHKSIKFHSMIWCSLFGIYLKARILLISGDFSGGNWRNNVTIIIKVRLLFYLYRKIWICNDTT